jgi:hypothetical protein
MLRKTFTLGILFTCACILSANAKIWRINNNAGVNADFTTFPAAIASASVINGDTVHIEPSATDYTGVTLTKRLIIIGVGYFLDPANTTTPGNAGLQATTFNSTVSSIAFDAGSEGSKCLGISFSSSISISTAIGSPMNLSFEKCLFTSSGIFPGAGNYNGLTVRKCFFNASARIDQTSGSITNVICENNIFNGTFSYINVPVLTGSSNIIRNNSFNDVVGGFSISNCYVANNIFGCGAAITFSNCVIKNNLFQLTAANQTLPGTATGNTLGVNMTTVYTGGTTGSLDSRFQLAAGSPAIGTGLTVGGITPNIGAFSGATTDSYKLSGIPNIPSIYTFSVPTSIPAGTTNMNVTISTRNNN